MEETERIIEYVPEALIEAARRLRQEQTSAEEILWTCLRDRHLGGLKFRRQHPIKGTPYIADFYCNVGSLVIELDGSIHEQQQDADQNRQQEIESLGYSVLRFRNEQIYDDLRAVLTNIRNAIKPSAADSKADNSKEGDG
ncbi:MAG: DUF559 domain-containing protein [Anaerolineae bacterium]